MRRRRLLAALGAGTASAVGGCLTGYAPTAGNRSQSRGAPPGLTTGYGTESGTETQSGAGTDAGSPDGGVGRSGLDVDLPVPANELHYAVARDRIPAIIEPAFGDDWSGLDQPPDAEFGRLPEGTAVVGVERGGEARAYPLLVLDWHEVVNDEFGGPLLVTYCPVCGSAVVAERRVNGTPTAFGVSGALWHDDLVMYDAATDSLWSQLLATAIRGPETGDRLDLVPAALTSWGQWRADHPDTRVLLPPPRSNTVRGRDASFPYFTSKYGYEEHAPLVGYESTGSGIRPRTLVVGVVADGTARAYPFPVVRETGVVNDRIGDLPVAVTATPDGALAAYDRRVGGRPIRFRTAGDAHLRAEGSRWRRATGRAVDGPHEGTTLARANDAPPMFWLGWSNFHPETGLYGIEGGG